MQRQSVFTTDVINEGRVFAENDSAFAFLTNIPITPGHSLVAPKRVVVSVDELGNDELIDLFKLIKEVKARLQLKMDVKGFNCAWNEGGREYGQTVPHLHIHIVPRTPGDEGITGYDPRQFLYRPGSRAESPTEELQQLTKILKD